MPKLFKPHRHRLLIISLASVITILVVSFICIAVAMLTMAVDGKDDHKNKKDALQHSQGVSSSPGVYPLGKRTD